MRILFHAPVLSAHRPDIALPQLLGVPPTVADNLQGLAPAHRLTGNRGNIIHAEAPARMLRKDPVGSAVGNIAALQRYLGESYRETLATQFDIIVISQANFIRPGLEGHRLFDALHALDGMVPFVVLGAGLQGEFALDDLRESNRNLIALIHERAALFGVRGLRTAAWLTEHGWPNVQVLGCPSLYVYPQSILAVDGAEACLKGNEANVMTAGHLSLQNGEIGSRGRQFARAFENIQASYVFQDEIFSYPRFRHDRFGYNEGNNVIRPLKLNRWLSRKSGVPVNFNRYYYFSEAGAWRQASMLHDVYVGDRFHGGVAALQAGQPAIFLKHDNRVSELTGHFDLPALPTPELSRKGLGIVLAEYLAPERLAKMKKTYRKRHSEFTAALADVGLEVTTSLPHEARPVPPATITNRIMVAKKKRRKLPVQNVACLGENYILRTSKPEGARELVVTFEDALRRGSRRRHDRPGFVAPLLNKAGYAVLSILVEQNHWYQAPELATALEQPDWRKWMKNFDRIHTLGNRMGSFGALAYADFLGADTVVAIQPITYLAKDLAPRDTVFVSDHQLEWDGPFRDGCAGSTGAKRIYSIHRDTDEGSAEISRVKRLAGTRAQLVSVSNCKAGVAQHLRRQKQLGNTILSCLKGVHVSEILTNINAN